jgi:hypothetical protein
MAGNSSSPESNLNFQVERPPERHVAQADPATLPARYHRSVS